MGFRSILLDNGSPHNFLPECTQHSVHMGIPHMVLAQQGLAVWELHTKKLFNTMKDADSYYFRKD